MSKFPGMFINIIEKREELTDKKTKKSELKSINKNDYTPPPGHISFLKELKNDDGQTKFYLIFHNGVLWKHGRSWDFAEDWFNLSIEVDSSSISTEKLLHVQAFHTTTKPAGLAMEECSTSMGFVQSAAADLTDPDSDDFTFLVFGGQSTETGTSSNRLEVVTGPIDFCGPLKCTAYRSEPRDYKELKLGIDFCAADDNVQTGEVPSSRCGHSLDKLAENLIICVGGLSIPNPSKHKYHPGDSNIFLLRSVVDILPKQSIDVYVLPIFIFY